MSLRDIFITVVVLGILPFALRHPSTGILLWTWISIMNPHKLAWGFAYNMPFAAMAAGVTFVAMFATKDKVQLGRDPIITAIVAFVAWMGLTTLLAFDRSGSWVQLVKVFKIQLMTLVAIAVLNEKHHLKAFVWVNALSLAFYGTKGGLFTLTTGGGERVWGPPGGFIEGNNELALALVMAIPLLYYLRLTSTQQWLRMALLGMMLLTGVSVLGTHSRGALLAIVAMVAFLWWKSPRKVITLVPISVLGLAMLAFMPENWVERMNTIQTYEQDGSAMGRINAWWTMFNLANDRFFGGGFDVYTPQIFNMYAPDPSVARAAHSIYFQVLGEHGWVGLLLFLSIWIIGWRKASKIRALAKNDGANRDLYLLAGMCQVSFIGYAVGGAFLSLAYFDLPYNILVMLIISHRLLLQGQQQPSVAAGPLGLPPRTGCRMPVASAARAARQLQTRV
ncbi:MAG TPA: putative O-glycosylation ligase, exosortase A system-associated [Burkholderiaceae bacterium]|nr:putative O-glycosylation ligase, exosortase A system-associated [Burkholderiaceae bacterium]